MNQPPRRIEIASFPGDKRIAVTVSFDDGVVHDRRVIKAFNEWGLKATFNLNSGLLGKPGHVDPSEVAALYKGHEVAIHSVTHPSLARLEASQIVREVLDDRIALENLVGYPVRGMAYPNGSYDDRVIESLRGLGLAYARTVETDANCFPAVEPLAWKTTAYQYTTTPATVPEQFEKLHKLSWYSGVFFVWGHTYEFENDWPSLERIFKPLSGRPDVWYCTNIELFDYEAARRMVHVAANRATAQNLSGLPVTLNVDGRLVDIQPGQLLSFV